MLRLSTTSSHLKHYTPQLAGGETPRTTEEAGINSGEVVLYKPSLRSEEDGGETGMLLRTFGRGAGLAIRRSSEGSSCEGTVKYS